MNQILSVDNSNIGKGKIKKQRNRNNGPVEIHTILKFFVISILIFGICIIASASYSMYKDATKEVASTKPIIYVENTTETEILLKVTHDKSLSKVTYDWNGETEVSLPCNNNQEVETTIELPTGVNTLTVKAIDMNGQEIEYTQVYTVEEAININIEPDGNNLKITANGKNTLQYMTYRWDEEEETKIEINGNESQQIVEIPKGEHTLTVIVVDENNKTETKEQKVKGVTKPKVEVEEADDGKFVIKASDEEGIKKIEFKINDKKYNLNLDQVLPLEERKEFEYSYELNDGENKIEVIAYNENDVTQTFTTEINK